MCVFTQTVKNFVCVLRSIKSQRDPSPDAGEGVEEIRRRVAPVIQHLIKREDVVVDAVVGEVGVFDAAKSDGPLSSGELLWSQDLQEDDFLLIKQAIFPRDCFHPMCFMALKMQISAVLISL